MAEPDRVQIPPGRLPRWLQGFARRHGEPVVAAVDGAVRLTSPDGAVADLQPPWGPLAGADPLAELLAQVGVPRRVGVLLVRRRAHAVGIAEGERLVAHRVGRHYVQGRTKAGGWSQQRYARRRGNQADKAFGRAVADVAELLVAESGRLDALLLGGDAAAIRTVLDDSSLAALRSLADASPRRILPVPDPNLQVLREALPALLAVPITLNEAARSSPASGWLTPAEGDDEPRQH